MDFITIWMGTVTILFIMAMWGWGKAKQEISKLKREKVENLVEYTEKLRYYETQVKNLQTQFSVELLEMVKRVGQNYKE